MEKTTAPENKLLFELNKTIQYSKMKVGTTLVELQREGKIDLSMTDASTLSNALNMVLEQVYRDMAPGFSQLKEDIKQERRTKK